MGFRVLGLWVGVICCQTIVAGLPCLFAVSHFLVCVCLLGDGLEEGLAEWELQGLLLLSRSIACKLGEAFCRLVDLGCSETQRIHVPK